MTKIAIDCRCLSWSSGSGIRRYLVNILNNLPSKNKDEYILLTNRKIDISLCGLATPNRYKVILLSSDDFFYKFVKTPYYLYSNKVNSYWSPTPDLPIWKPKECNYYVTLHDIFFESKPQKYNLKIRALRLFGYFKYISHLSNKIITDSEFVKRDIVSRYQLDTDKVVVSYLAVDPGIFRMSDDIAETVKRERFGIRGQYIFHIDCANPLPLLLAYCELIEEKKIEDDLVLLGGITPQIEQFIELHNLSRKVILVRHYVSDHDLSCLYTAAHCLVTTSADEGFGLAPLEALNCGCNIVIPNAGCLPEIYACSATYFEYNNAVSLKIAILKAISANTIIDKKKTLLRYSWKVAAATIYSILHSL